MPNLALVETKRITVYMSPLLIFRKTYWRGRQCGTMSIRPRLMCPRRVVLESCIPRTMYPLTKYPLTMNPSTMRHLEDMSHSSFMPVSSLAFFSLVITIPWTGEMNEKVRSEGTAQLALKYISLLRRHALRAQQSCCLEVHKKNLGMDCMRMNVLGGKFVLGTYHPWDVSSMKGLTLPELRDFWNSTVHTWYRT